MIVRRARSAVFLLRFTFHFYFLVLSDLQQVLPERDGDGFGAVGGVELLQDVVEMFLDAVFADAELAGDVLVGETAHD